MRIFAQVIDGVLGRARFVAAHHDDRHGTSKREIFASRILDHLKFAAYFDGIDGTATSKQAA
jgi:hypothetical protein